MLSWRMFVQNDLAGYLLVGIDQPYAKQYSAKDAANHERFFRRIGERIDEFVAFVAKVVVIDIVFKHSD